MSPPPSTPGFISLWVATHLKRNNRAWLDVEAELEFERATNFSDRVSRLRGFYVFGELNSAERALSWKVRHFKIKNLAELYFPNGLDHEARLDANWITFAMEGVKPDDWMQRYWSGDAYPYAAPIWEYLVDSKGYVLGTELRSRAYSIIKRNAPKSLCLLELSRLAGMVGSDLGSVSCFFRSTESDENAYGEFVIDMREGNDSTFLGKLDALIQSGGDINREAIGDGEMVTLDSSLLNFTIAKKDYPYFGFPVS